jgi:hypothetical protein
MKNDDEKKKEIEIYLLFILFLKKCYSLLYNFLLVTQTIKQLYFFPTKTKMVSCSLSRKCFEYFFLL